MDPLANMFTSILNAQKVLKEEVSLPSSKMKLEIAKILKKEGFIEDFKQIQGPGFGRLLIKLKYKGKKGVIREIRKVSKPGRRIYVRHKNIPIVLRGFGIAILSTSKGVMTNKEAKKKGIGGEVICEVW